MLTTAGPCCWTIDVKLGSAAYTGVLAGTVAFAIGCCAGATMAGVAANTCVALVPSEDTPASTASESAPATTRLRTSIFGFMT